MTEETVTPDKALVAEIAQPVIEETPEESHAAHGDTTVFMGREYNVPLYTGVFIALGAFTVIEVLLAEIISSDAKVPLLLGIMFAKALLVVMFYMHLKDDNRIFAYVLGVPVGIAVLATLFLIAIPAGY